MSVLRNMLQAFGSVDDIRKLVSMVSMNEDTRNVEQQKSTPKVATSTPVFSICGTESGTLQWLGAAVVLL